jgi:hypothetical protein
VELPPDLVPVANEPIALPDGLEVAVPKATPTFASWRGQPLPDTFGGKPALDHGGEACFAELVILRIFLAAGWSARWVETYGAARLRPRFLTTWSCAGLKAQAHQPITDTRVQHVLESVAVANGGTYSGCWDVVAWRAKEIVFAESKLRGHDKLHANQRRWFAAGIAAGLSPESFLVVEWSAG